MNQEALQIKKQKAWRKMEKGSHSEAIAILQKVLKSQPNDAEAYYLLGCCQGSRHLWEDALKSFESSIKIQSNIPQSHFSIAGVYIALGQPDLAISCLNTALKLNPQLADAHVVLGNIQLKENDLVGARDHFDQALKINPKLSDAFLGLGALDQEEGDHSAAIAQFEQALKFNAKSVNALCAMANSLANLTKKDEAKLYYKKALKIDKQCTEALCGLALVYNFYADYEKALKLIDPLLKKKVMHSTLGVAFAQCCKHADRCHEAIDYIELLLKKDNLLRSEIKALNFSVAHLLDGIGQYDKAFSYYKQGNQAISYLYDSVANTQYINDIINVFTPALFMSIPVTECKGKKPVFIIGMPRSGTSLVEQILAAHSNVYAAGELDALFKVSNKIKNQSGGDEAYPFYVEKLTQNNVNDMAGTYLKLLEELSGAEEYVTDKMPHNFYMVGLIQILFPDAKIIHCKRDPVDTCLSIYFQDFSEVHKYAKDLFNTGTHYHQYQRLMNHWDQVLSIPMLDVHYEELVGDQEAVTRRMLEFCGLGWEDSCMQFHKVKRTVDTASVNQVRQPLYKKSVKRWKNYEKYIGDLLKGLDREF